MGIQLKVWGDMACFTRPEMKVERVSYDVITPSAARGILEAIYWKPQIRWVIDRLHVLKPIHFTSLRRNEVGGKASAATAKSAMTSGTGNLGIYIEEDRQQRAATLLRDVSYLIEAHFEYADNPGAGAGSGAERNDAKHLDQFNRRASKGQCFHRPYLGCREFPADFESVKPGGPPPEPHQSLVGERDLGYMLYDMVYAEDPKGPILAGPDGKRVTAEARFFRAKMIDGVIDVARLITDQGALA